MINLNLILSILNHLIRQLILKVCSAISSFYDIIFHYLFLKSLMLNLLGYLDSMYITLIIMSISYLSLLQEFMINLNSLCIVFGLSIDIIYRLKKH